MNIDPSQYSIQIRQIEVDGEMVFEARIKELPDVVDYGESVQEAYDLATDTIIGTAEAFLKLGREFPLPAKEDNDYSGRVTLRIPKTMHRHLAMSADSDGVSLNTYIIQALSYFIGKSHAPVIRSFVSVVSTGFLTPQLHNDGIYDFMNMGPMPTPTSMIPVNGMVQ